VAALVPDDIKGKRRQPLDKKASAKTNEVIAISFIKILIEGPLVSFKGSPTVSPTTAALCASEFLPYTLPL